MKLQCSCVDVPVSIYYIDPPLGAYKSQLRGAYSLSMLVYNVIDSCDLNICVHIKINKYKYINQYIYIYIHRVILFLFVGIC